MEDVRQQPDDRFRPFPPSAVSVQMDIDIAWMAAWRPADKMVMLAVGKALRGLSGSRRHWRIRKIPDLVEWLRMWRTGELSLVNVLDRLEQFETDLDANRWRIADPVVTDVPPSDETAE